MTLRSALKRRVPAVKLGSVAGIGQGIASCSTLVVGLVVAREMGAAALGQFSFLLVVLTLFVAIQSAWVGDALAVLPSDERSRVGISTTQWVHVLAALIGAPAVALVGANLDLGVAALFGLATAAWELREYGRRALIARLAFGRQIVADMSYLVLSSSTLVVLVMAEALTPGTVWLSVLIAAGGSAIVAILLLPRGHRLLFPRRAIADVAVVAQFGFWRAAQIGTGYVAQVGFRYAVIVSGSFGLLGAIEAARIVVAPLLILFASLTNVLLPFFARQNAAIRARTLAAGAGCLCGVCVLYGTVALAMSDQLADLLYGGSVVPPTSALLAWIAVATSVAVAAPYTVFVLVRRGSRIVFNAKVLGAGLGLATASGACLAGHQLIAPLGLALGNFLSAGIIIRASLDGADRAAAVGLRPSPSSMGSK